MLYPLYPTEIEHAEASAWLEAGWRLMEADMADQAMVAAGVGRAATGAALGTGLPPIIDRLLPVWAALRVSEVYWEPYSFGNLGDSAAFLRLCRHCLGDPGVDPDWRAATIHELVVVLGRKLYRDWNTLIEVIELAAAFPDQAQALLLGLFINLLLLKRQLNPRLANDKSDLEHTAAQLRRALVRLLGSIALDEPSYGLAVAVFRLLPQINDEDRIGTIRALSERFDEDRADPADPWRTRANSLRKAIHQKPSEQNIQLVEAYLAEQEAIASGAKSGPVDLPDMVELARDLLQELRLFWSVVTDRGMIERAWNELLEAWPWIRHPAQAELTRLFGEFHQAAGGGQFLEANARLTELRKSLKKHCQQPPGLAPAERGSFRFDLIGFEVAAEHLSFAYQSSLCNQLYAKFSLEDLRPGITLLGQVIRSVRCSGGGDKQLGRTGMLLEQENRAGERNVAALRGIIKDILNQTKSFTDAMKRLTDSAILAMLREWQPEMRDFEGDRQLISLYNSFFRSTSFLHLGEFAAFLSAALLPYGEARSRMGDESADSVRLFWRFHGGFQDSLPPEGELRYLVGGKAASLLAMHAGGLPVPEGFCLATQAGRQALAAEPAPGSALPELNSGLWQATQRELAALEKATGLGFGDPQRPLLLSVRSGAPVSMPGMMDTILNIGLSDAILAAQATDEDSGRFWYDCRFHLIWLFASSVHAGVAMPRLATAIKAWYHHRGEIHRLHWTAKILAHALELYREYTGSDFPEDPQVQLRMAIAAVFRSWNSLRAWEYRAINHIPDHLGTGVTIQRMVFGNRDKQSASGVYFTRDPETGRPDFGEMVVQGQGEEVVSGQNSPIGIRHMEKWAPSAWAGLLSIGHDLERRQRLPQDIEFTIESGRLWILQSRNARLTTRGRLLALIDMVDEGLITSENALGELHAEALEDLDSTTFAQRDIEAAELQGRVLAHGLGVFHGVATGLAAFSLEGIRRLQLSQPGSQCILVKEDTKPEDIEAMYEAIGCATRVGGPTSHAAINARVIGRPCVVNCTTLTIVKDAFDSISEIRVGDQVVHEGDPVSLDGNRALFIAGALPAQAPESDPESRQARQRFLAWHQEREMQRSGDED